MRLNIGFSTCPNDTFIFDAMVHQKINTEGLSFNLILEDIEKLNQLAEQKNIDIVKLSYHAFAYLSEYYKILDSGSALGNHNGPILISKYKIYPDEIKDVKIAIPGEKTTANLLLKIAYPEIKNTKTYLFSDIEEVVLSGEMDAGLIIHENRFTFEKKGLKKIIDLGEFWENKTKMPIPLGAIVVNNQLNKETQTKVNRVLKRSVRFAIENPHESLDFMKKYAQNMNQEIMYKHIQLYVNSYTENLGEKGKNAILKLYEIAENLKIIEKINKKIFII